MGCTKCPHHVRHGSVGDDKKTIKFSDLCGLKHKKQIDSEPQTKKPKLKIPSKPINPPATFKSQEALDDEDKSCIHFPFTDSFDYQACQVYREYFSSFGSRNVVIPTKDFQYSDQIATTAVTDMELL